MEKMRNIVRLDNFPSNIVDEVFIVLKQKNKVKKNQTLIDFKYNFDNCEECVDNYIVKEAEMIISDYLSLNEKKNVNDTKYKKLIIINVLLFIIAIIGIVC